MNAINCIQFDKVKQELAGMRQVSYSAAVQLLQGVRVTTTSAALLAEYAPERLTGISGVSLLERPNDDLHPIDEAAFQTLADLFPCNTDIMWEDMVNGESVPGITIDPVFNMDIKEFGEYIMEPENFGTGSQTSLLIFVYYLGQVVDAPYFELAAEHFGWSVETPEYCTTSNAIDYVDMDRFFALLNEHSLSDFALAFRIHEHANDNLFLDLTLDDVYENFIPYTMESIHDLVAEWAYAQPRIEELKAAAERFTNERWIASRLIGLWDQCVRYKDGRAPRTLLELWRRHPVTDEFYGEIGMADDEEDDD